MIGISESKKTFKIIWFFAKMVFCYSKRNTCGVSRFWRLRSKKV